MQKVKKTKTISVFENAVLIFYFFLRKQKPQIQSSIITEIHIHLAPIWVIPYVVPIILEEEWNLWI